MPPATSVLFVCDSGEAVGGGHVMRCLTLADALAAEGIASTFLAPPAVESLLDAFDPIGCARIAVETPQTPQDLARAAAAVLDGGVFTAVVLDHFGFGATQDGTLRAPGRTLLAIEDFADRTRDVDILLDASFGRTAEDYAGLAAPQAELLLGPAYALVRPEFAAVREQAPRRAGQPVRRVLISLGLTDVGGLTERVIALLEPTLGSIQLDVLTGSRAPSLPRLRERASRDPRVNLHVEATNVAELMSRADLAVGAGGSTTWERACLGLPTLTLVLADNQAPGTRRLADAGLTLAVDTRRPGFEGDARAAFVRLLEDPELRSNMSRKTAELCDGRGAARVAACLRERLGSPTGR